MFKFVLQVYVLGTQKKYKSLAWGLCTLTYDFPTNKTCVWVHRRSANQVCVVLVILNLIILSNRQVFGATEGLQITILVIVHLQIICLVETLFVGGLLRCGAGPG